MGAMKKAAAKGKRKGKGKGKPAAAESKPAAGKANNRVKSWEVNGITVQTTLAAGWDDGRFSSVKIMGHPLGHVLRALGRQGITAKPARRIMDGLKLTAVRDASIRTEVGTRASSDEYPAAPLSKKELAPLLKLAEGE